ncbi:hypothetical protein JNL27_04210 [bacterium]|nr:hypothetical protein [bacterium]
MKKVNILLLIIVIPIQILAQTNQKISFQFGGGFTTPVFTNHPEDGRKNGLSFNGSIAHEISKSSVLLLDFGYTVLSHDVYQYPIYTLDYYEKASITDGDHRSSFLTISLNFKFKPWLHDWPNTYLIAGYGFVRSRMPSYYPPPIYYPLVPYEGDVWVGENRSHSNYGVTYHIGIGKTFELTKKSDLLIEAVYRENRIDISDYRNYYGYYSPDKKTHLRDASLRAGILFRL